MKTQRKRTKQPSAPERRESKAFLAIDPGANGAAAFTTAHGDVVCVPFESPDTFLHTLRDFAESNSDSCKIRIADMHCVVEKVGGYIGKAQPASSAFRFGENYGFIQGVLRTLRIPYELVSPAVWQKAYPTHTKASEDKAQHKRELRDTASRLFPEIKVTLKTADALLLLDFARKQSVR